MTVLSRNNAFFLQQGFQLAGLKHFGRNITATDEFALDVNLGNGWPVAEFFDAFADGWVGHDVDVFKLLNAKLGQDLDDAGGEAAHGEVLGALHVDDDVVVLNVFLELGKKGIVAHG